MSAWAEGLPLPIGDSPPGPPATVTVTPAAPTGNNDLQATATGTTDPDGDACSYIYQGNVSTDAGVTWAGWVCNGRILPNALTSAFEKWKAQARALSGNRKLRSVWVESPVVTVGARASVPAAVTASASTTAVGTTQITLTLSAAADLRVRILNLAGREVAVLPEQSLPAGTQTLLWYGKSVAGTAVPSGQYLLSIDAKQEGGGQSRVLVPLSK